MYYALTLVDRTFLGDESYFDEDAGYYPFSDYKYAWWYRVRLKIDIIYDNGDDYLCIGDVPISNAFNMYKSMIYQEGEGQQEDDRDYNYDDETSNSSESSLSSINTSWSSVSTSSGDETSSSSSESSESSESSVNDGWDPRLLGLENDTSELFLGRVINKHNEIEDIILDLGESSCFINDPYELIKVIDSSGYLAKIFNKTVLYLPAHPGLWSPHLESFLGPKNGRLGQFLFPGYTIDEGMVTAPYCQTLIPRPTVDIVLGRHETILPHHPDSELTFPPFWSSDLSRSSLSAQCPESVLAYNSLFLTDQQGCIGLIPEARVRTTNVMLDVCGTYETPSIQEMDDSEDNRLCWWSHSCGPDTYFDWLSSRLLGSSDPTVVTTIPTCWFNDYPCYDPLGPRPENQDQYHDFQTAMTPNDEFIIELDIVDQQVWISGGSILSDDYQEFHIYYYLADKDDVFPPMNTSSWTRLSIEAPFDDAWMNEHRRQPEDGVVPPKYFYVGGNRTCETVNFGWKKRWAIDTSEAFCIHVLAFIAVYEWENGDGYLMNTVDFKALKSSPTIYTEGNWGSPYGTFAFPRQVCPFGPIFSPFIGDKVIPAIRVPDAIS